MKAQSERPKADTRTLLADAARQLVREQGYRNASVDDIAAAAGVATRTFFRHFPTKEAALFAYEERWTEMLKSALSQRPLGETLLESIRKAVMEITSEVQKEAPWIIEVSQLASEVPAIRQHMETEVGRNIRAAVRPWAERRLGVSATVDPRPTLIAAYAAACLESGFHRWLATFGTGDLPALVQDAFDQLASITDVAPTAQGASRKSPASPSSRRTR